MDCSTPGFPVLHSFQSLLKLMSIESVMPSNHLILCHPLLLLPSIFPSIRVFSNESVLHIRWPKYWSFNKNFISCYTCSCFQFSSAVTLGNYKMSNKPFLSFNQPKVKLSQRVKQWNQTGVCENSFIQSEGQLSIKKD